ncbi:MAG: hypothetical protein MK089_11205 [Phycisphaerales bacterium]|nr:hypothetical protein [Phycisphaerales bacterium]
MRGLFIATPVILSAVIAGPTTRGDQGCPFIGNEIVTSHPCDDQSNEFWAWNVLTPVPAALDRVIWDGSFTEATSSLTGPGSRWLGHAGASSWGDGSPWRRIEQDSDGNGHLVMRAVIGYHTSLVYGQPFGDALDDTVLLRTCDSMTVRFRARTVDHDCGKRCWVEIDLGQRTASGQYEEIPSNVIEGYGTQLYIPDSELNSGDWIQCGFDLSLLPGNDYVDITHWAPRVVFGIEGDSLSSSIELHIDDIEVNLSGTGQTPLNLVDGSSAGGCNGGGGAADLWWTLITDEHYLGGGQDETSPLSSPPSIGLADTNGDGQVNVLDLLTVIADWDSDAGDGDVNGDGLTNVLDLLAVIADWGAVCP